MKVKKIFHVILTATLTNTVYLIILNQISVSWSDLTLSFWEGCHKLLCNFLLFCYFNTVIYVHPHFLQFL